MGASQVPDEASGTNSQYGIRSWKCAGSLLPYRFRTLHHAQAPAGLDHSRTLPQGDGSARPALAGGEEGGERDLIVLDAGDVLDGCSHAQACQRLDDQR